MTRLSLPTLHDRDKTYSSPIDIRTFTDSEALSVYFTNTSSRNTNDMATSTNGTTIDRDQPGENANSEEDPERQPRNQRNIVNNIGKANYIPCSIEKLNQRFKRHLISNSIMDDDTQIDQVTETPEGVSYTLVTRKDRRKVQRTETRNDQESYGDESPRIELQTNVSKNNNGIGGRIFVNSKNKANNGSKKDDRYALSERYTQEEHLNETMEKTTDPSRIEDRTPRGINANRGNNAESSGNYRRSMQQNETARKNIAISQHALQYAVENHLPPMKIECHPKISDNLHAKDIIKNLLAGMEKEFKTLNKGFSHSLGFDYWYTDQNGDLVCFTKHPM